MTRKTDLRHHLALLCGASLGVLAQPAWAEAMAAPDAAPVQAAPAAGSDAGSSSGDEAGAIVVTGSRITRDGYQAPTPVTVATSENLLKAAPASIPDGLNRLPQFLGSSGPNRSNNVFATPTHGNILNLRGLGGIRTLILFDGVRSPPTSYQGTVDVDVFPQLLIQRVDVVTAGASSAYGSDAVAGVVNFVLDKDFTGIKGSAQGGISSRGDNQQRRFGLAGGFKLGDRGHLLLSFDHFKSAGYLNQDRPRLDDQGQAVGSVIGAGRPGTPANPYVQVAGIHYNLASFGGLATNGPFANTAFITPDTYRTAITGTPTGSAGFYVGGDYYYAPGFQSASAPTTNDNVFGRLSYDLTDNITAFGEFLGAQSIIRYNSLPNLLLTPQIFSGNAFLPAALQAQLTAANTPSFTLAKEMSEMGPITARERVRNITAIGGLRGKIANFDWDVTYVHGDSVHHFRQGNQFEETKLAAAMDAVVDPATSQIVCRPTLSADPAVQARYAGCVPFNPFGLGASSPAARDYVTGVSTYRAKTITNDVTFNVSGDLFTLPAGPVSIAVGADYRNQTLDLVSNSDPAVAQDITGLRGLAPNTTRFYLSNVGTAHGSNSVKEAFGEIAIPVLRDAPFARSLDLNGAIRYTDYSTSGGVTTWKAGGTWAPIDDIRFRVTRSRDIRAPTLYDLFAGAQFTQSAALDPHTNISGTFFQRTSGNPNLKPEVGNTWSIGVVLQPRFVRNFALSVDFYDVKISGAITTLSTLQTLQDCESSGGTAPSCASIIRPFPFSDHSPANYPTEVGVVGVNIASIKTRGIDFDASYRATLGRGRLSARLYATYIDRFMTQLSPNQPLVNYAGYNAAGAGGVTGAVPKFKGSLSLNYDIDEFSIFVQEGLIGRIKFGPTLVYDQPDVPEVFNTDLTLTVRPKAMQRLKGEVFLTVNNLFDRTPPLIYGTTAPGIGLSTAVNLYDTTGRMFTAGVRLAF